MRIAHTRGQAPVTRAAAEDVSRTNVPRPNHLSMFCLSLHCHHAGDSCTAGGVHAGPGAGDACSSRGRQPCRHLGTARASRPAAAAAGGPTFLATNSVLTSDFSFSATNAARLCSAAVTPLLWPRPLQDEVWPLPRRKCRRLLWGCQLTCGSWWSMLHPYAKLSLHHMPYHHDPTVATIKKIHEAMSTRYNSSVCNKQMNNQNKENGVNAREWCECNGVNC